MMVDDVVLSSREEAENVLDRLDDLCKRYGNVTVSDIFELVGFETTYDTAQYGWDNLALFGVKRKPNGYALTFPEPSPITELRTRDIYKGNSETPTKKGFSMEKTLEEKFEEKVEEIKTDPKIITKGAIKMAVGWCASAIATIAIHTLVPKDALSRKQKIQLSVAAWAMGGAVADCAGTWAAEESFTGTLLCAVTDQFKKPETKTEKTSPKEETTEETPTE